MSLSKSILLEYFTNKNFIQTHLEEYVDFIKDFHPESSFVKNPKLIFNRYDSFYMLMTFYKNGDLQNIFDMIQEKERDLVLSRLESQLLKE